MSLSFQSDTTYAMGVVFWQMIFKDLPEENKRLTSEAHSDSLKQTDCGRREQQAEEAQLPGPTNTSCIIWRDQERERQERERQERGRQERERQERERQEQEREYGEPLGRLRQEKQERIMGLLKTYIFKLKEQYNPDEKERAKEDDRLI